MTAQSAEQQVAILQAAVALRDAGCTVVPTRKDGGKAPAGKWKDYQTTPPSGEQIAQWFARDGHTGIGIITGKASGNVEMAELEGRAVELGMLGEVEELAINSGLADLYDRITQGWSERTPSGGIHWYYRIRDGIVFGNTKLATDPTGLVLAETRGEGGFSVVAPSHGNVHPTGLAWEIINGGPATMATITYDEREAFLALFRSLGSTEQPVVEETRQPGSGNSESNRPGDDYNARATWDDILIPRGWTKAYTDRLGVTYWVRPGKKPADGISATTGRNAGDNFYCFSTSVQGIDTDKAYSKFALYTALEHHGDWTAAARALAREGYGDPTPTQPTNELKPLPALNTPTTPTTDPTPDTETDEPSTWAPINLEPHWDGTHNRPQATLLYREDGPALLYPGRVHSFYGESESGKSWLAQIAAAETLRAAGHVVYIDFEADAADIVDRLRLLGIQKHHATNLRYLRPETARRIDDPYWQTLTTQHADLIVIDGVTEALTMWGGETKDNDTITTWTRLFPRTLARATGAAVVLIDHVAKNADSRGRFAIGGQAKLAAIDGAAYLIEPIDPVAPGKYGQLTIRVTKDRPGTVRAVSGAWRKTDRTQEAAVATIDATGKHLTYKIRKPRTEDEIKETREAERDRLIIEYVIAHPGCTKTGILEGVKGGTDEKRARIGELVEAGLLSEVATGGRGGGRLYFATEQAISEYGQILRPYDDVIEG